LLDLVTRGWMHFFVINLEAMKIRGLWTYHIRSNAFQQNLNWRRSDHTRTWLDYFQRICQVPFALLWIYGPGRRRCFHSNNKGGKAYTFEQCTLTIWTLM
jgi:hypothetical protein